MLTTLLRIPWDPVPLAHVTALELGVLASVFALGALSGFALAVRRLGARAAGAEGARAPAPHGRGRGPL